MIWGELDSAVKLQRGNSKTFAHHFIENSEHLSFHPDEKAEMTGVACLVTYQLALMLRLDMVWFTSLVQPLRAQNFATML